MSSFDIKRIQVRRGAADFEIEVELADLHVTNHQAERMLVLLPNLARHVCVNGKGDGTFGDEIAGTELPHLFEHIVIELQGGVFGDETQFTGHTSWLEELELTRDKGYAAMRTTVTFANDLVVLQAARDASDIIDWMLEPGFCLEPDIEAILDNLAVLNEEE